MARSGERRARAVFVMSVAAAAVVIAAACSGGSSHVSAAPGTTATTGADSATTAIAHSGKGSSTKRAAKPTAKKATATVASTAAPRGSTGTTTAATSPNTVPTSIEITVGETPTSWAVLGTTVAPTKTTPTTVRGPKPYDPSKPIDLGGEPGVTPAEQARAEQLVRDTLRDLPHFASPATAYAEGYRTIGDGFTGTEHYVKWAYVNDGHILDSHYPESLVYQMRSGHQVLVSAMYILPFGTRFTDAPDLGGALTQWHIHSNLCLVDNPSDPLQKVLDAVIEPGGTCPPNTTSAASAPMLHVWIVANKCGPFAPLDGVGAGDPPPGQQPLCDTGHGG